jgi:hypothetical protein
VPQEHVFPVRFYSSLRSHRTGSGNRRFVAFVLGLKEETLEWRTRSNSRYRIRRPKPRKTTGGHIIHSFTNRDDFYTSYLGVEYSFVFEPWSKTCGWADRLAAGHVMTRRVFPNLSRQGFRTRKWLPEPVTTHKHGEVRW